MLFPWVGMLEQLRHADVLVHYDDVQFSRGSFTNRVQVKTEAGSRWMTLPLRELHLGQTIAEVRTDERRPWREQHLSLLRQAYQRAPHRDAMLALVERVYADRSDSLLAITTASVEALAAYFGVMPPATLSASSLGIGGSGSARVLSLVRRLGGTEYVTGHGARRYLEHERFEAEGIDVRYMRYGCAPYPQQHGTFTPYVTGLDLVANLGAEGRAFIASGTLPWREFLQS